MIRKSIIITFIAAGALLVSPAAFCDSITIMLDNVSTFAALPSQTVSFAGTLTGGDTQHYLNGASFTIPDAMTGDVLPFLLNFPSLLDAGESKYGTLFDITINADAVPGTYYGYFNVLGGETSSDFDLIGTAPFSVAVGNAPAVPEPATAILLASGAMALARMRRKLS